MADYIDTHLKRFYTFLDEDQQKAVGEVIRQAARLVITKFPNGEGLCVEAEVQAGRVASKNSKGMASLSHDFPFSNILSVRHQLIGYEVWSWLGIPVKYIDDPLSFLEKWSAERR